MCRTPLAAPGTPMLFKILLSQVNQRAHAGNLTNSFVVMCGSDTLKTSQAQSILRKLAKIDLDQAKTLVENDMKSAITDGDKLSQAQAKVDAVSGQMQ